MMDDKGQTSQKFPSLHPFEGEEHVAFQWLVRGAPGDHAALAALVDKVRRRPLGTTTELEAAALVARVLDKVPSLERPSPVAAYKANWLMLLSEAEGVGRGSEDEKVKLQALELRRRALERMQELDEVTS